MTNRVAKSNDRIFKTQSPYRSAFSQTLSPNLTGRDRAVIVAAPFPFPLEASMKPIRICVLVGVLSCSLVGATAWAQATTAQISGTVKDQSGAVLPGVEITAT